MVTFKPRQEKLLSGNLVISNAVEEDAEDLMRFKEKVHHQTKYLRRRPEELDLSPEKERQLIEDANQSDSKFLIVARYKEDIVGYLSFQTSPYRRYSHQGELRMSVDKDCWGKGIGSYLLKFLIDWGANNDLRRIELLVGEHNNRAVNLYRKFGFKEEGRLKDRRRLVEEDEYEDELIMAYIYR